MADLSTVLPYVRRRDEGEAWWFLGNLVTLKAAGAQTRGQLTVAEFVNPAGFAPPVHRHRREDELFYVISGNAVFSCADTELPAGPGDFVFLPVGLAHTFLVGADEPLRALQITTPSGFEGFAAAVGGPASERRLPDPAALDPAALAHAAELFDIEILGPPPSH